MIPDVINFEVLSDYKIKITLSNGSKGIFDVKPYLERGIFKELRDYNYFKKIKIEYGTITWPHEQDFSPETIETKMRKINDKDTYIINKRAGYLNEEAEDVLKYQVK